jgi:hypothetical protein
MDVCISFVLCSPEWVEALRRANPLSRESDQMPLQIPKAGKTEGVCRTIQENCHPVMYFSNTRFHASNYSYLNVTLYLFLYLFSEGSVNLLTGPEVLSAAAVPLIPNFPSFPGT